MPYMGEWGNLDTNSFLALNMFSAFCYYTFHTDETLAVVNRLNGY